MSFPTLPEAAISEAEWKRKAKDVVNAHSRAFQANGTTAARPAANLYVGQAYFDTTLGRPIWWNGAAWVDASGASV